MVIGLFPERMMDNLGPGGGVATCQFNHDNPDVIGGGMLADDFIVLPIISWKMYVPRDMPRWGLTAKHFMREKYRCLGDIKGPVHEIPSPDGRVTLDTKVRDTQGIRSPISPAPRIRRRCARRRSCTSGPRSGCGVRARRRSGVTGPICD